MRGRVFRYHGEWSSHIWILDPMDLYNAVSRRLNQDLGEDNPDINEEQQLSILAYEVARLRTELEVKAGQAGQVLQWNDE